MSQHAKLSPEAELELRRQKRNSTISSIIIAFLISALIVLILLYISLSPLFKNTEELVAYTPASESEKPITKPEMTDEVQKKPSTPSSSMARLISVNIPSPTAVPVTDQIITEPSIDFGDGNDFGDGWGNGGGNGAGGGGGGFTFFKQKVKAERVCYVIDYSQSMSGKKIELLKAELKKSIDALPDRVDYQLLFFAGPVWVAGDEVKTGPNRTFTIKSKGREYEWITKDGAHAYEPKDKNKAQQVEWITSSKSQRKKSLETIQNTPMVWGTIWNYPLEMAINMNPKPNIIFFMTDGSAGKDSLDVAKEMGRKAKKEGIIINTIALMLPQAKEAMGELAKRTGGVFTMVDEKGNTTEVKLK